MSGPIKLRNLNYLRTASVVGTQGALKGQLIAEMFDDVQQAFGNLQTQMTAMQSTPATTSASTVGVPGPQGPQGPQGASGGGSSDFAMDFLVMGG